MCTRSTGRRHQNIAEGVNDGEMKIAPLMDPTVDHHESNQWYITTKTVSSIPVHHKELLIQTVGNLCD